MGGLGGNAAQVGINAGDGRTFVTHNFSFTDNVLNIVNTRVPEDAARVENTGVLMYRVDSTGVTECVDDGTVCL